MDNEVQYLRIRDFEAQVLQKLLDKEPNRDVRAFADYKVENQPNKHRHTGLFSGDCYSRGVDLILESIGLGKYIKNFKANDVGVNVLIHMDEDDLAEIGITDFMDQALFQKQLSDFHSLRYRKNRTVYKIEDDLIMAQNICAHLEDINSHLNLIQHYLRKSNFEDYYISPRKSLLAVFNIVISRALVQAKRMSDVLFTGTFNSDALIPAYLQPDGLQLPDFMTAKLYKPDKNFRIKPKRSKHTIRLLKACAAFSLGVTALAILIIKGQPKN